MNCLPGCWKGGRGCGSGSASQARRHRPSRAWRLDHALEAATSSFTLTPLTAIAGMAVSAVASAFET
jgi:hypothetical protein